jgi:hypothetical protein
VPILADQDVAIWCCKNADVYQVIEFKVGDPEPIQKFCSKCGDRFVTRCPNKSCPHPTYHPSDVNANVHGPCGSKIPWGEARNRAVIIGPGFHSKLLGSGSSMGKSTPRPSTPELTAQERQDLIVPPSARLPAPSVASVVYAGPGSGKSGIFAQYVEYLQSASAAIDKPPRKVVRAVLKFLRDRGEVVGRGADKGLEDAATWVVKIVILAVVLAVIGFFGMQVFFRPLVPGL